MPRRGPPSRGAAEHPGPYRAPFPVINLTFSLGDEYRRSAARRCRAARRWSSPGVSREFLELFAIQSFAIRCFLYGALVLSAMTACTSDKHRTLLNQDDIRALSQIYAKSPATLRQQRLLVTASTDGAVELTIQGDVSPRDRAAPVTTVTGRPEDPSVRTSETLEPDEESGSLWLPTVLVRELPSYFAATSGPNKVPVELQAYKIEGGLWCITALIDPSLGELPRRRLELNVLLVSPAFASALPIAVPVSQASAVVEVSLRLPDRTRLVSSKIVAADHRVSATSDLTLLPASISAGHVEAATRLSTRTSVAWDLSRVQYEAPPPLHGYIRRFWLFWAVPLVLSLYIVTAEFWWRERVERERRRREWERAKHASEQSQTIEQRGSPKGDVLVGPESFKAPRRPRYLRQLYWLTAIAAICALLGILTSLAFAQTRQPKVARVPPVPTALSLGELGVRADPLEGKSDRVALGLSFFALSNASNKTGKAEVVIDLGQNSAVHIVDIRKKPDGPFRNSHKQMSLTVPATVSPAQGLLNLLAGSKVTQYSVSDSYLNSITAGQLIQVECILAGAHTLNDWTWDGRLHLFPLESRRIEISLELTQPALLSRVELLRIPDFVGDVTLLGAPGTAVRTPLGYQLVYDNQAERPIIAAKRIVTVTGQFRRTLFQRIMLTVGQCVLAIACGIGLGFLATAPDKNPTRVIIQATGILVIPLAYRAAVFAVYKDLPIFWLGQSPPTVFEVSFVISAVFFIATSLVVAHMRQRAKKKSEFRG